MSSLVQMPVYYLVLLMLACLIFGVYLASIWASREITKLHQEIKEVQHDFADYRESRIYF